MQVEGEMRSSFWERPDPHERGLPLSMKNVKYTETWTNSVGDSFSLSGKVLSRDIRITSLGGSVYEVTSLDSGQPQVMMADGSVLARDLGNFNFTLRYDLDSGAVDLIDARISDPHPGFAADICTIVAPFVGNASAEDQTPRTLGTTDASMGYYEYLPPSYSDTGAGSPLLVVTNGYGANGDGSAEALGNLLLEGVPRLIDVGAWPLDRPFVVLSTQHIEQPGGLAGGAACEGVPWFGSCIMQFQHDLGHPPTSGCTTPGELHDFISYATDQYNIDLDRVYTTGLSCGGFGVWEYLAEYGDEQVAAAVPIAGDGRPAWPTSGCGLSEVPIWAIHGEFDDVVNPAGSIDPATSLSGCPGVTPDRAKLSIYPGLTHEGWEQAYSGSEGDDIYSWMLSYTRN
jgi:predicted esterase